ncbi:MAG: holo-[acyl-carrier-protein] synthase [Zetaproteobacteria bacterium CG12_big_fil_rev_8_21_14_0_65_55_1124]|nr:MAG: holo-[acyl-carrier-protein] synthase [Zetaproteobacteria bacterium CG08_land_8_20_14_0_20_55_17]PIW42185.1 MAG: holo-[acyl-carrier-protein] synthase [Zetaproteobacteria bacterium CG12_big_fil_rev_8_21_14_0_65_55_1124]PIY54334.1 MAG: holo-[acyl-carrier-protein] synthase [Zetaproteobacteria bacterium CG_4_10_14_0_8_um_filter_55_43]PIZ38877.1 MAG: holo-[acyl-carrier-protein] synthase [Zetaproteobacteria bacterium CG_4_10_14_0_2_um_filter_55_20]PJB82827.1 MAG: holo-[acyl-carrier-protein] sy
MIVGIGTDRLLISRVAQALARFGVRFEQRVYTEHELRQAEARGNTARRLAMLFAAKEAVAKALGTGFHQGVAPKHIETIHQASGKPEVFLHDGAADAARRLGVDTVHVSLTDDDGVAMAFAVAESLERSKSGGAGL